MMKLDKTVPGYKFYSKFTASKEAYSLKWILKAAKDALYAVGFVLLFFSAFAMVFGFIGMMVELNQKENDREAAIVESVRTGNFDEAASNMDRPFYARALIDWVGVIHLSRHCTDNGFVSDDPSAFACALSGPYRIEKMGDGEFRFFKEEGKTATVVDPYETNHADPRYVNISALVKGLE